MFTHTYRTLEAVHNSILGSGERLLATTITIVVSLYWIIRLQRERAIRPRDYGIKRRRLLNNQPAHFLGPVDGKVVFFTRVGNAGRLKASFPDLGVKIVTKHLPYGGTDMKTKTAEYARDLGELKVAPKNQAALAERLQMACLSENRLQLKDSTNVPATPKR